jgi:hypothetical protein
MGLGRRTTEDAMTARTKPELNPGYYRDVFRRDGRTMPAGVHFLVLTQNGKKLTRKLVSVE